MQITGIHARDLYCFIDIGRDGHSMTKHLRMDVPLEQFIYALKRASREADRDISMKTHGDLMHCEDETANNPRYKVTASA